MQELETISQRLLSVARELERLGNSSVDDSPVDWPKVRDRLLQDLRDAARVVEIAEQHLAGGREALTI